MSISVLLVDDNLLFRRAVADFLQIAPDIQIVGEADDGAKVQAQALAAQPQVVVLDWMMAPVGGLETLCLLRRQNPGVKVIVLSMHADEVHLQNAVQNGACGYVLKEDTVAHLVRAIRAVSRGESYFSPRLQRFVDEMN